jgi:DNA (cytosine-5)-methyltransferase 1
MTTSTSKEDTLTTALDRARQLLDQPPAAVLPGQLAAPTGPRIGSLFTGTGVFDLAVMDVFGGETVWHSQYEPPDRKGRPDTNQYAAKILAHHWPDVPNLGDITAIDWDDVLAKYGPVDIIIGGFPCTDVSTAGERAGLTSETRSGLWSHMAQAISILKPDLVVIENVEGLLSAKASSNLEPCPYCVGDGHDQPPLRALGAVLGDLAVLGFDAEWQVLAASEVDAAHKRKRVIIYAWPSDADPANIGHQWGGGARRRGHGSTDRGLTAAHTDSFIPGNGSELPAGWNSIQRGVRNDAPRCSATSPDADSLRRRADILDLRPGQPDLDWGDYGPAIRRWEATLGRPVPWPTDALGRLTPVFTEWHMGYPDGWVTCTPGLTRNAMLRALGNGAVPLQMSVGIQLLRERANGMQAAA